ncbi:carboxypeptidase-like regulatory domain-containing protein [Alicyclobacillus ferrooxydans]|uniref:carboxypeptidase-like regulatory domain-containing protein n=1 Tax=Alicyclobacillus ferrooxydans TaxID=471514 RepID=UPI0006D5940E|nr:carboxypeptidase-like regulatory domain-containing protein [Alicyclobacillus ferrooxydans]
MTFKAGVTGIIGMMAAGAVAVQLLIPVVAHASTSIEYAPTTIEMAGNPAFLPQHVVANDPWSGKPTSWVPIYYLQQALRMVGVYTTWNGNTLDITSVPSGWNVNLSRRPQAGLPPAGQMQFAIYGNQDALVRAPKLVADDPATNAPTTYVPIYYANLFLQQRLYMGAAWTNTKWIMSPSDDVNRIQVSAIPSTANVGQSVTISGELVLAGGVGAPYAKLNVSGLPNTNNKTLSTNAEGQFSFSTVFTQPGTYPITVSNSAASWQIDVTVR